MKDIPLKIVCYLLILTGSISLFLFFWYSVKQYKESRGIGLVKKDSVKLINLPLESVYLRSIVEISENTKSHSKKRKQKVIHDTIYIYLEQEPVDTSLKHDYN